jgi:hypothetical protein
LSPTSFTPDFFIIGAPKCGTTALAQLIAAHPQVFLSDPKEPHFFDADYHRGLEFYRRTYFLKWRGDGVTGEATPSYLAAAFVPQRIYLSNPQARLIAILRNPIDRAYSSWWMLRARSMETMSFPAAIAANEEAQNHCSDATAEVSESSWQAQVAAIRTGRPLPIRNYLETGYYARHLQRYLQFFPPAQLHVVFSDDLQRDTERTVREIWRHLGVADHYEVGADRKANEAMGVGAQPLLRLARLSGLMRLRSLLPDTVRNRIKRTLSGLGNAPKMDESTRGKLIAHFEPHVRELETLLKIDLSHWRR